MNTLMNIFKTLLAYVGFQQLKKTIDRYPEPARRLIIFFLRLGLFFIIFLAIFSFCASRINSVISDAKGYSVLSSIFTGVAFIISLVVSLILTGTIERSYKEISNLVLQTKENIQKVKETPAKTIKKSIRSTKTIVAKTGNAVGQGMKKLYNNSMQITGALWGSGSKKFQRILEKKKSSEVEVGDGSNKSR